MLSEERIATLLEFLPHWIYNHVQLENLSEDMNLPSSYLLLTMRLHCSDASMRYIGYQLHIDMGKHSRNTGIFLLHDDIKKYPQVPLFIEISVVNSGIPAEDTKVYLEVGCLAEHLPDIQFLSIREKTSTTN